MIFSNGIVKSLFASIAGVATFMAMPVYAELKPLEDEELGQYSGQGAIAFDINELGDTSYTRVTLGMEADVQMNIDTLELGNYAKTGESLASDIDVSNIGFGSISTDAAQVQLDGQTYAVNDIVPFEFNDPFFEVAQNDVTGELTGFRIGFGEARGQFSGDFNSFSGNVGMEITDFFGDTYQSTMLDAAGNDDNSRVRNFGVSQSEAGGVTDCSTGFYCYDLADYKTLDVGQRNTTTGAVDYTEDFFISFQKEAMDWSTSDGVVNAALGMFMNIPTSMNIDMNTGVNASGTDRVRTEFIDRGNGRF